MHYAQLLVTVTVKGVDNFPPEQNYKLPFHTYNFDFVYTNTALPRENSGVLLSLVTGGRNVIGIVFRIQLIVKMNNCPCTSRLKKGLLSNCLMNLPCHS